MRCGPFRPSVKLLAGSVLALLIAAGGAVHAAGNPGSVKVGLRKSAPGTFYVAGSIGAAGPVDFLVDTGSSYTVINDAILAALEGAGQATFSRKIEGRMADGSTRVVSLYTIERLRLGADCVIADVEAAVFAGSTRPILGIDTLARLAPFTFSADPPHLEFGACSAVTAEARPVLTATP